MCVLVPLDRNSQWAGLMSSLFLDSPAARRFILSETSSSSFYATVFWLVARFTQTPWNAFKVYLTNPCLAQTSQRFCGWIFDLLKSVVRPPLSENVWLCAFFIYTNILFNLVSRWREETFVFFFCRLETTPLTEPSWWTPVSGRPWRRRTGTASSSMMWTSFQKTTGIRTSVTRTPSTRPSPWTSSATSMSENDRRYMSWFQCKL